MRPVIVIISNSLCKNWNDFDLCSLIFAPAFDYCCSFHVWQANNSTLPDITKDSNGAKIIRPTHFSKDIGRPKTAQQLFTYVFKRFHGKVLLLLLLLLSLLLTQHIFWMSFWVCSSKSLPRLHLREAEANKGERWPKSVDNWRNKAIRMFEGNQRTVIFPIYLIFII